MLKAQSRSVNRAVLFQIPDKDLILRLSGRRTCPHCSAMYHIESLPSKKEGICDQCGTALIQRADDQAEVVKKRLAVYHQQTEPLAGYYQKQDKLLSLNAAEPAADVFRALVRLLQ
jgi:adenylate kinase